MTRPHDPTSPRWHLAPEPLPVDLDVLMATSDGWVPVGRLAHDGAVPGDLTDDELVTADRWSRLDLRTTSVTFPDDGWQLAELFGLVTTVAPNPEYL